MKGSMGKYSLSLKQYVDSISINVETSYIYTTYMQLLNYGSRDQHVLEFLIKWRQAAILQVSFDTFLQKARASLIREQAKTYGGVR